MARVVPTARRSPDAREARALPKSGRVLRLGQPRSALKGMVCLIGLILLATRIQAQEYDSDWKRNFRVGPFVGMNIKANFRMSGGSFNIGGNQPGVYDDGYVRVDDTGNAGGLTSFWGYDNASQFDGNQTLTMHQSTSFTPTGSSSGSGSDAPYIGLDVAYGGYLWRRGWTRVGWELGFGMLPIKIRDSQTMSGSVNRRAFTFNTGGIVMPPAGYEGGSSGVGPLIGDTATEIPGDSIPGAEISGSRTLDVTLYTLRLGPTVFLDLTPYLGLSFSGGGAVGYMSGDLKFDETISYAGGVAQNTGKVSGNDITYGGYVGATLTYHSVKNGDVYVGVQYMPMGKTRISGGGREAELKLGGQIYISAGFNWLF